MTVGSSLRELLRSSILSNAVQEFGGAREDRTPDLYNAIVALSQLSYGPKEIPEVRTFRGLAMLRRAVLGVNN